MAEWDREGGKENQRLFPATPSPSPSVSSAGPPSPSPLGGFAVFLAKTFFFFFF